MRPHNRGPFQHGRHVNGNGSEQPVFRFRFQHGTDHALARRTRQQRKAVFLQRFETVQNDEILVDGLAEAKARIKDLLFPGDPCLFRQFHRDFEEPVDVRKNVQSGIGGKTVMHHNYMHAASATTSAMAGSFCRPHTSLTMTAPAAQARRAISAL